MPKRFEVSLIVVESYEGQYDEDSIAEDIKAATDGLQLTVESAAGRELFPRE